MKIRELFQSVGLTQSFGGKTPLLSEDDCCIRQKKKNDNSIMLTLVRDSDNAEAHTYLRVQKQFESVAPQLLNQIFANDGIIGLTLNELLNFETNITIESSGGRISLK